jgi:hypothetical protein
MVDWSSFNQELVQISLVDWINDQRVRKSQLMLREQPILQAAATLSVHQMVAAGSATLEQTGKHKTTKARLVAKGGTGDGVEFVLAIGPRRNEPISYARLVAMVREKLAHSRKFERVAHLWNGLYMGLQVAAHPEKQKVFLSLVVGPRTAFQQAPGAPGRLGVPITKSSRGLKMFDKRACRSVARYPGLFRLQDALAVKQDEVWLTYRDFRTLKRVLREPTDGLAVEFVQRAQYLCDTGNVLDVTQPHRGVLLKPIRTNKLFKKNTTPERRLNTLTTPVGKLKTKDLPILQQPFEMNLLVIKDKHVCWRITPANSDGIAQELAVPITILPDSNTVRDPRRYRLEPETGVIEYAIPLEQNKARIPAKAVAQILKKMAEPQHTVTRLDAIIVPPEPSVDSALQEKRMASLLKALGINAGSDIAAKHRVSNEDTSGTIRVRMGVRYDISDPQTFLLARIDKAVQQNDAATALRMQRYVLQQISVGKFDPEPFLEQKIPMSRIFQPLLINQLYLSMHFEHDDTIFAGLRERIEQIYKLQPENEVMMFNKVMIAGLSNESLDPVWVQTMQKRIDALYGGQLTDDLVDRLNMEFQFRIIEIADTMPHMQQEVAGALDRIRTLHNLFAPNWQSALKMARLFLRHGDPDFAERVLSGFVGQNSGADLNIFYVKLAAIFEKYQYSIAFDIALHMALEQDPGRMCELLGGKGLTFQLLDHPAVKHAFCNICN